MLNQHRVFVFLAYALAPPFTGAGKRMRFFFKLGTRTLEYLPKGADAI